MGKESLERKLTELMKRYPETIQTIVADVLAIENEKRHLRRAAVKDDIKHVIMRVIAE